MESLRIGAEDLLTSDVRFEPGAEESNRSYMTYILDWLDAENHARGNGSGEIASEVAAPVR